MKPNLIVYLADDHTVVRKGMMRLLKSFARVSEVNEASNGKDLIAIIDKKVPDAVILDVEMPVMGGVETAKYISDHYPQVKVLILTMHAEEAFINRLMDMGVHAFLTKASEPEEVEKALYAVVDKDFYKNDIVSRAMVKALSFPSSHGDFTGLSDREMEVLLLICQECSPGEISERLKISEKTFFNHRANILAKTHMRTNVGLVRFAHQKGLIRI